MAAGRQSLQFCTQTDVNIDVGILSDSCESTDVRNCFKFKTDGQLRGTMAKGDADKTAAAAAAAKAKQSDKNRDKGNKSGRSGKDVSADASQSNTKRARRADNADDARDDA